MLTPGFTVLISIKLIFAEHHYVPIFNTKNNICGGRYEGIKSGNSFIPIGRVNFPPEGSYKIHSSLRARRTESNIEYSLNWPRNIDIIGTTAVTALREIWTLLSCL